MKILDQIPKPVKKMIVRAAAGTVAGELLRKAMGGGNGRGAKNASNGLKAAFRKLSGKAAFDERMSGLGRKAAAAVTEAVFPEKPGRVKLHAIHGSKKSALDRLADLGLTTAVNGPIERMRKRKRRTDAAGTAAVALAKVLMRVKW